jgi:hypothetical protein
VPKGENNSQATLSDGEVELIRQLYEGDRHKRRPDRFWTAPQLAERFEVSLRHIRYITSYQRRAEGKPEEE